MTEIIQSAGFLRERKPGYFRNYSQWKQSRKYRLNYGTFIQKCYVTVTNPSSNLVPS